MVDPEGLGQNLGKCFDMFHMNTQGRCIFRSLEEFPSAFMQLVRSPDENDALGDAHSITSLLDPFQDNRAGERIGSFIRNFSRLKTSGVGSDNVLRQATVAYAEKWGWDKIISGI